MRFILGVGLALLVASFLQADELHNDQLHNDQLHQAITLSDVHQQPLREVLAKIGHQANLRISYELDAINTAGVSLDTRVSANMPSISLGEALKVLLQPNGLDYEVSGNGIIISTPVALANQWKEVRYSVGDLIGSRDSKTTTTPNQLAELIASTVAPNSWEQQDGMGKITIEPDTQSLSIWQTAETHRQIANLLTQLRTLRLEGMPKQLAQHLVTLNDRSVRLSNVLREISEQCGLNICLQSECGDPVVSLTVDKISAEDALTKVLAPLNLRQKFTNESVLVYADTKYFVVMYPVDDLLKAGSGRNLESMVDQIKAAIEPGNWNHDDNPATIQAFSTNKSLVVCQNEAGHEQISAFLARLRAVGNSKLEDRSSNY